MGLLRQVTGNNARRKKDGSWRRAASGRVIQEVGMKPLQTYIDQRQATLSEWMDLRPIFEVWVKETGYKGEGRN